MALAQQLVERTERRRRRVSEDLDRKHRARLGQFFTSAPVADFLAELLDLPGTGVVRLIDPGAGIGSLVAAVVARALREQSELRLHVVAFELDPALAPHLFATLEDCENAGVEGGLEITTELRQGDFIAWASEAVSGSLFAEPELFSACVMNPPYRKVNNSGADRAALELLGLPVTNLYAAFLALGAAILEPGGQLSAITPRSFANGVYFKPFREFFLSRMSFDHLHVYEQRGRLFADADVLQENVVFRATRATPGKDVILSTSVGHHDTPTLRRVRYDDVVRANDPHLFIRIPVDDDSSQVADQMAELPATLTDLDLQVSTGRVVDFRARGHLRQRPSAGTVPLIYPTHLRNARIEWPQADSKKPNALASNEETAALLLPNDTYAVVKRFSAKEERRRVVAALATPDDLPGEHVAFENHLNVFHAKGRGLPRDLALGMVAYLNSTLVDRYVRQFSGHTQINATDLRQLRYPSRDALTALGVAYEANGWPQEQEEIDALLMENVAAPAAKLVA